MFRYLRGCVIWELRKEVIVPLRQLKLLRHLGVEPTHRMLLHGPPGCGKTTQVRAVANEAGVPFHEISATDLVSGVLGAPELYIRKLFSTAYTRAPSIVFIDEIDAMTSKTECLQKEIEPRLVNQLMACMDKPYRLNKPVNHDACSENSNSRPGYVVVIGATNRPDAVHPALRRRFDREIIVGAPDEYKRHDILSVLSRNLKVEVGFDLAAIARCTLGFAVGDLAALVKRAGMRAVDRIMNTGRFELYNEQRVWFQFEEYCRQLFPDEKLENVSIIMTDFVEAAMMVQPSCEVECFSSTPNAQWDDVGGLELVKLEFERHVVKRIKFPEVYKDLGVNLMTNFFLYGPNGCGKTLIVEALANEAGAKFIHIKGPELVEEYGAQGKLVVRIIFRYTRTCSPCILFFDELEAIACRDAPQWPVFGQLLLELNSTEQRSGVYVVAATNGPEAMSHSLLNQGRFNKPLYVPLPTPEERGKMLKALARNKPIDANVDLISLGKDGACENFNGADLSVLMKEAAKAAIDQTTLSCGGCSSPWTIKDADFKSVLAKISPSVSSKQVENCKLFAARFKIAWEQRC